MADLSRGKRSVQNEKTGYSSSAAVVPFALGFLWEAGSYPTPVSGITATAETTPCSRFPAHQPVRAGDELIPVPGQGGSPYFPLHSLS